MIKKAELSIDAVGDKIDFFEEFRMMVDDSVIDILAILGDIMMVMDSLDDGEIDQDDRNRFFDLLSSSRSELKRIKDMLNKIGDEMIFNLEDLDDLIDDLEGELH